MKKRLLLVALAIASVSFAQEKTGVNTTAPQATLDVVAETNNTTSDVEGILIPRVSKEKAYLMANATTTPEESTLVYVNNFAYTFPTAATDAQKATVGDITENGYYYWNGVKWVKVASDKAWSLVGNDETDRTVNFLGTTDLQGLSIRTNNLDRITVTSGGDVGIGTDNPSARLDVPDEPVYAGTFLSFSNDFGVRHPYFVGLARGNGSQRSDPSFVEEGDVLSSYIGRDHKSNMESTPDPQQQDAYTYGGSAIYMRATEDFSATNKGSDITFSTTANGANILNTRMRITNAGNVGIGTLDPESKLDVRGVVNSFTMRSLGTGSSHPLFLGLARGQGSDILTPSYVSNGDVLSSIVARDYKSNTEASQAGSAIYGGAAIYMYATEDYSSSNKGAGIRFSTTTNGTVTPYERMRISNNGNIGIGVLSPTQKLHVDGNILATGTITPDYVFQKYYEGTSSLNANYRMMSLKEIESFTRVNKHLPGVPSAQKVKEDGGVLVNRATEINLEKIEELFLHTIEQEKKIEAQNTMIENQQKEIDELKSMVKQLLEK